MRHIHADHMIAAANDTTIEWQRMSYDNWANIGKSGQFTFYPESQYRQRPSSHPHQAMMDVAKDDPSIEWQILIGDGVTWLTIPPGTCCWNKSEQYRQKPAEPKMVDMYQWAVRYDSCSPIYAGDNFYENEIDVKNDRPGFEILCRIEGSKISVEVLQ
jgi:hypothetical protein